MKRLLSLRPARFVAGLAISATFVAVTLGRVDLSGVLRALRDVQPAGIALAFGLVWMEVGVRAFRWQILLAPIGHVPYHKTATYLCIGYFANSLLPARLGDIARAYLAGSAFGIPRLATLGTIVVERLADGLSILLIVIVTSVLAATDDVLVTTALVVLTAASAGALALLLAAAIARRSSLAGTRAGIALRTVTARVVEGGAALRTAEGFAIVAAMTILAFGVAVGASYTIAAAVGIELSPIQACIFMGALALSTSIPAAPGSLGTYEFVGVTVLVSLGSAPEPALATVLLVHVLASVPTALAGLAATWLYHIRVGSLVGEPADGALPGSAA